MSENDKDPLRDIANAILRLKGEFQRHHLDAPVEIIVRDREQMIKLAMVLRAYSRLDYSTDLDAPTAGGDMSINVCGVKILAKVGPDTRRVSTIIFKQAPRPLLDPDEPRND